jgi:glucose/arabinose dehydrogenase
MNKRAYVIVAVVLLLVFGWIIFKENIGTINIPSTAPIASDTSQPSTQAESMPGITVPAGFSLSIFAKNVPDARVIEIDPTDPLRRVLVSETSKGKIVALTADTNTTPTVNATLANGLNDPHGLAIKCDSSNTNCFLYVAERNMLSRYPYDISDASVPSLGKKENLMPISSSLTDRHFTRSLLFLPAPNDSTLLISVGSSCNVCHDTGDHASILSYNIDTKQKSVYATGLRNATFMTLDSANGEVFATEMGRDNLGDNIPPDEVDIIQKGPNGQPQNYGWPNCYGQNIHDTSFDKNTYIRNPCMAPFEIPALIDLQAHSAPLGLSFVPGGSSWPADYQGNLLVAYHGSWNRSVPTGYKIVRIRFDASGKYLDTEDFITGWLTKDGTKTGRPVDIKVLPNGTAYISDDSAGVIYKLSKD